MILSLFRYSGNKGRMFKYYRSIPVGVKRIVEPYLGSGSYSINHSLPAFGIEKNIDLVAMWHWLQNVTIDKLMELDFKVRDLKKKHEKPDVRLLGLELGPQTYVRVNVCSLMIGQLSSWSIYPQFDLPIKKTILALSRAKNVQVVAGDALDWKEQHGDLLFVDPPYIGTRANYKQNAKKGIESDYKLKDTVRLIEQSKCPVLFTYGDGAPDLFPMFEWEIVKRRKVPNVRLGGSIERTEYAAYIRWERDEKISEEVDE